MAYKSHIDGKKIQSLYANRGSGLIAVKRMFTHTANGLKEWVEDEETADTAGYFSASWLTDVVRGGYLNDDSTLGRKGVESNWYTDNLVGTGRACMLSDDGTDTLWYAGIVATEVTEAPYAMFEVHNDEYLIEVEFNPDDDPVFIEPDGAACQAIIENGVLVFRFDWDALVDIVGKPYGFYVLSEPIYTDAGSILMDVGSYITAYGDCSDHEGVDAKYMNVRIHNKYQSVYHGIIPELTSPEEGYSLNELLGLPQMFWNHGRSSVQLNKITLTEARLQELSEGDGGRTMYIAVSIGEQQEDGRWKLVRGLDSNYSSSADYSFVYPDSVEETDIKLFFSDEESLAKEMTENQRLIVTYFRGP